MPTITTTTSKRTPWGPAQTETRYRDDIHFYTTARHGGFHATGEARKRLREAFPGWTPFTGSHSWYEEDVDACAVIVTFPELFDAPYVIGCQNMITARAEYFGR